MENDGRRKSWNPVKAGLIDDSDIMSLRVDLTNPERLFLECVLWHLSQRK
jgi:hypothetical protein